MIRIYGDDRKLRGWLEQHTQAYVLAVSGKERVWKAHRQQSVKALVAALPSEDWVRLSAGMASKGPRWYDWVRVEVHAPVQVGWKRWLVARRSCSDPTAVTAYVAFAPAETSLAEQVRVAGMRRTVEESIQSAKGEVGLDQYEVRSWRGWYRHITLAMWAQAFLSVVRAERGAPVAPKKGRPIAAAMSSLATFKAQRGLRSG